VLLTSEWAGQYPELVKVVCKELIDDEAAF
jgi:hypothetical protein